MRRNAKMRRIIRQITMPDIFSLIKHFNELPQKGYRPFRYRFRFPPPRVNIVQVEDMRKQKMPQHFFPKEVFPVIQPFTKARHVGTTFPEVVSESLITGFCNSDKCPIMP